MFKSNFNIKDGASSIEISFIELLERFLIEYGPRLEMAGSVFSVVTDVFFLSLFL